MQDAMTIEAYRLAQAETVSIDNIHAMQALLGKLSAEELQRLHEAVTRRSAMVCDMADSRLFNEIHREGLRRKASRGR